MKLFTTKQIAKLDEYTIKNEPVQDIDLMERASMQITNWIVQEYSTENKLMVFAGPGNNGGDAMAIARQLADLDYQCELYLLSLGKELKGSPRKNWKRLQKQDKVKLCIIESSTDFPEIMEGDLVLDGLFGAGLTRPLEGLPAFIVQKINTLLSEVVAIDIPSGLMGENNSRENTSNIVRADYTLTFEFPKVSFLFPENEEYVGVWEVLPIGLHQDGKEKVVSNYHLLEKEDIKEILPIRSVFEHKGTLGHALLIAGSFGKMGASVLSSRACLRSGVGLLTTHAPRTGYEIIQTAVPEAMVSVDQHDSICTEFPDLTPFSAVAIGPGLDKKPNSCKALCHLLDKAKVPLVIDADALNVLAENQEWLKAIPEDSILTPHPGEFKRIVGETSNSFDKIGKQLELSVKYKVNVVLKGAFTTISTPSGKLFFNSSGNPGMATAGSGDVLTGIILGLLAQGMSSEDAAKIGVYVHGLAGDLAAAQQSEFSLIAGDIINNLGKAFRMLCD